ncbi:MAG TPA: hypothetical protein VFY99_06085 [Solirubrobacterales bacterium]
MFTAVDYRSLAGPRGIRALVHLGAVGGLRLRGPPIARAFTYGEMARGERPAGELNHAIVVATPA